jgi:hypothetical protein
MSEEKPIQLTKTERVSDNIINLQGNLERCGVPTDRIAYRLTREEANMLAGEILRSRLLGLPEGSLEAEEFDRALRDGWVYRKIHNATFFGVKLIVEGA